MRLGMIFVNLKDMVSVALEKLIRHLEEAKGPRGNCLPEYPEEPEREVSFTTQRMELWE